MTGDRPPLLRAVDEYLNSGPPGGPLRLHVPGHKGGAGAPPELLARWGPAVFRDDVTELPGLDDLAAPAGAIAASQSRTACSMGAAAAHYLVQGSTGGIIALLLAAARGIRAQTVLLPRCAHRSLASAAVLAGMRPVFIPVRLCRGIPCGIEPRDVHRLLSEAGPGAVVFDVYPNAYGVVHDLAAVSDAASSHGAALFVDGAHSGLFGLHPALPPAPLCCGASAVVVSAHKTLGSLGQSSLLLLGDCAPDGLAAGVTAALRLTGTTSPSYPLLLSLEAAVRHAAGPDGARQIETAAGAASAVRCELRAAGVALLEDVLPESRTQDPLRLVIDGWAHGMTGLELAAGLRRADTVQVEAADWRNVLAVFGLGDGEEAARRMGDAVRSLRRERDPPGSGTTARSAEPAPDAAWLRLESLYAELTAGPWEAGLDPRSAWFAPGDAVELSEACGRLAGEPLAPYPPGVPVAWPGEVITGRHVEFLRAALDLGLSVHGLSPQSRGETARRVRVVR